MCKSPSTVILGCWPHPCSFQGPFADFRRPPWSAPDERLLDRARSNTSAAFASTCATSDVATFRGKWTMDSDRGSWSVFKTVLCRVQFGFEKKIGECCIPLYFWLSTDIWYIQLCGCQTHLGRHSQPYQDPRRTLEQLGVTEVQFIQVDYLADQHLNEQWRALAPPDETHGVTEMGFDTKVVWRFEGHSKTEVL